jgi:hypothetical protein
MLSNFEVNVNFRIISNTEMMVKLREKITLAFKMMTADYKIECFEF